MLVLFLRTFNYIFPYFFFLNNKYASRCVHHSFSTQHFLSTVDGWVSSHINISALHHAYRSTCNLPFHSTINSSLVLSHSSQIRPKSGASLELSIKRQPLNVHQPFQHFGVPRERGTELGTFTRCKFHEGECLHFHWLAFVLTHPLFIIARPSQFPWPLQNHLGDRVQIPRSHGDQPHHIRSTKIPQAPRLCYNMTTDNTMTAWQRHWTTTTQKQDDDMPTIAHPAAHHFHLPDFNNVHSHS